VKHILLPVDAELLNKYRDLQARLEERMDREAGQAQAEEETGAIIEQTTEDEITGEICKY